MTLVSVIAPPPSAPQIHSAAPLASGTRSSIDPLAERICRAVRTSEPVHIWKLLNQLVKDEAPPSRLEARQRKLELWKAVNHLLRRKVLFRAGRHAVTTTKPSLPPVASRHPVSDRRKPSTVVSPLSDSGGSTVTGTPLPEGGISLQEPGNQRTTLQCGTSEAGAGAESAAPLSHQERANAARALAKLRWQRKPKKWSGWLDKRTRIWRDRQVVLPDGTVAYAYGALRGRVVYFLDQPRQMEPGRWGVARADQVTPLKNRAAVAMGRLKQGVRERPSLAKQRSARLNGSTQSRSSWSANGLVAHDD